MSFSHGVLIGVLSGVAAGLFLGELAAPLEVIADAYVRLLQMTVLPYVVVSIIANLGTLTYQQARTLGLRAGAVMGIIWLTALVFACLVPLAFPPIESASFYSPTLAERAEPFDFVNLYIPSNPFHSLANSVVPAVVLFSVMVGLALIGVENKKPLLDVLQVTSTTVGRIAKFIIKLTPIGIFAIAANTAGTLDIEAVHRIEIYLIAYVTFAVVLALWVLPGMVSALTPIGARECLAESKDALLTAFIIGDLFIVLPALMTSCSTLIERRLDPDGPTRDLPSSIIPTSFTFPHTGKILSLSFILFAGWFSDSVVPMLEYPQLILSGFFAFFGSLNAAVPFLLDLFRIPADTFDLFLATSVVNARFGTLVAATHTLAVGLLGSAAIAGKLRFQPGRLLRFLVTTSVLTAVVIVGLRMSLAALIDERTDGRTIVNTLQPMATPPVDNDLVIEPSSVPRASIPRAESMLEDILDRGVMRVGLIDDGIPYEYRNDRNQVVGLDIEMAHALAADLGVGVQFVRFPQNELDEHVGTRVIDIVMTGARATPERAAAFALSDAYLDETMAMVTLDHNRRRFRSWDAIRELGPVRLGVQNLPYYVDEVRRLLPDAQLTIIPESRELIDPDATFDAYVLPAERGSVLTMLNPRFSVVIPEGASIRMPLAYPIAGSDPSWVRVVNTWIGLKEREGFIDDLYAHWILGRAADAKEPRWSIIRNVLHWVD